MVVAGAQRWADAQCAFATCSELRAPLPRPPAPAGAPLGLGGRPAAGGPSADTSRLLRGSTAPLLLGSAAALVAAAATAGRARQQLRHSRHRQGLRLPRGWTGIGLTQRRAGHDHAHSEERKIPVIVLSGFLGTGKTTLLKHWLENADSRVGVVVNDVAAVNIDASDVQRQRVGASGNVEMIQLENGCACCSMGDEFLMSLFELVELTRDAEPFEYIVIELSGVAEPKRIKDMFVEAQGSGSPLVKDIYLSQVVTLLDTSTFCKEYMAKQRVDERPDLCEEEAISPQEEFLKVVELLVEQVEGSNVVVLNKLDLASEDDVSATRAVVTALNAEASICETSYGKVPLRSVLGHTHKEAGTDSHGHEEGHEHAADAESHDHGHAEHHHSHGHAHAEAHDHSHSHDCADPACTDPSHDHSHAHQCSDPGCTDPSHDHSHSHQTTAEERFGITSFTYTARRPFSKERLAQMLEKVPVARKEHLGDVLTAPLEDADMTGPLSRVIRAKGFCWIDDYPSSRMYWSIAGQSMVLSLDGVWWGAVSEAQLQSMQVLESVTAEYESARSKDWSEEWADRRQEIVFIGQRMDEPGIRALLDGCLLSDEELAAYKARQDSDAEALMREWSGGIEQYEYQD